MRISVLLILALAGCSGMDVVQREERDSAPVAPIDLDTIPPVIPQVERITAAGNRSPYTVLGGTYQVMETASGYSERGLASWYGTKFHGRLTSNGEVFNMYALTAAHRSLPIPAYVRVRNLQNNLEIIVRVNDRGPFHSDRIIDLSWAAAAKLGFAEQGVAEVEITAIDPAAYQTTLAQQTRDAAGGVSSAPAPLSSMAPNTYLQVAALRDEASLRQLLDKLVPLLGHPVEVLNENTELGMLYRVQIGPISERGELNLMQTMLELSGLSPGFVVQRDACAQSC